MIVITSGKYRRRRLKMPQTKDVKPTQSILRLGVFNFLADFIDKALVLDLFAGSGAFGIEALSRGAKHVTFVDKLNKPILTIKDNIKALNLQKQTSVFKDDALHFLVNSLKRGRRFDIIFIDPPYEKLFKMQEIERKEYLSELLDRAFSILNPKSIIILKLHKKIKFEPPKGSIIYKSSKYGLNKVYYIVQKDYVVS